MEQLKVKQKDTIILNVVIYLCLSFFFLYIQHGYRHQLSPFSVVYFKKGLELFWYVAVALGISCYLIWSHHRLAIASYQLSIMLVSFKIVEGLFIEFNKIIVIALFFYLTISYFLYQLLNYYLRLASINANYHSSDLFDPLLRTIPCEITSGDIVLKGILTNWDHEGCFIKLSEPHSVSKKAQLKVIFREKEFIQIGEVVAATEDLYGVGIKFNKTIKDIEVFNWAEFIETVHELGFQPERLR